MGKVTDSPVQIRWALFTFWCAFTIKLPVYFKKRKKGVWTTTIRRFCFQSFTSHKNLSASPYIQYDCRKGHCTAQYLNPYPVWGQAYTCKRKTSSFSLMMDNRVWCCCHVCLRKSESFCWDSAKIQLIRYWRYKFETKIKHKIFFRQSD